MMKCHASPIFISGSLSRDEARQEHCTFDDIFVVSPNMQSKKPEVDQQKQVLDLLAPGKKWWSFYIQHLQMDFIW